MKITTDRTNFLWRVNFYLAMSILFLLSGCVENQQTVESYSTVTTILTPSQTVSITPTVTTVIPTQTPVSVNTKTSSSDKASFVSENYPDNSILKPGQQFTKTWQIKNSGSSNWTTNYFLKLRASPNGETLGASSQVNFQQSAIPGETITLSVDLVAPQTEGTYYVYWSIVNEAGETVAVDGSNLWVKIKVSSSDQTVTQNSGENSSVNGISFELTKVASNDQTTTVSLCASVSLHVYSLDNSPKLLIDQEQMPFVSGGSDFTCGEGCMVITYQASQNEIIQAQEVELVIDGGLRMSPPPGDPNVACETARQNLVAEYDGLGFQCNFSMSGYYTRLSLPGGMSTAQANSLIIDTIEGAVYGPWTIRIK